MTSFSDLNALAALRGEGLHPKLNEFILRSATAPVTALTVRRDGMLQAGPDPTREVRASPTGAEPFRMRAAPLPSYPSEHRERHRNRHVEKIARQVDDRK
jgi:hypothetical protein